MGLGEQCGAGVLLGGFAFAKEWGQWAMAGQPGLLFRASGARLWFHTNRSHHAAVFVLEQVAVIDEGAHAVGIAKIHAQLYAGILERAAVVVGHVDGIAEKRLVHGPAGPFD